MLQNIGIKFNPINAIKAKKVDAKTQAATNPIAAPNYSTVPVKASNVINNINTSLSSSDTQKYVFLTNLLKDMPVSKNAEGLSPNKQLDYLLKSGKLLQKSSHDNSTTLDNLYEIASKSRVCDLDNKEIISNALDLLVNPRYVTQRFGDIPQAEKQDIQSVVSEDNVVKKNPNKMNVTASGTCAAASLEVNMADKYPAEFARWVNKLSSLDDKLILNVKTDSISSNKLEALEILNLMDVKRDGAFSFDKNSFAVLLDEGAYLRAKNQEKNWDYGERNIADVLIQSAIMQIGSQNTYNSLTDTRGVGFSSSDQGLIELEKTFVESLIKNKDMTSIVYQEVDENENLVGYRCPLEKIEEHIKSTIDSGDDVILGYVLTNETFGATQSAVYNPQTDGAPNYIIAGHEITVVDYKKDENGKTVFVCIDTDDDNPKFVEYSADWLLPKINHAGYPASIVKGDAEAIMGL